MKFCGISSGSTLFAKVPVKAYADLASGDRDPKSVWNLQFFQTVCVSSKGSVETALMHRLV